MADRGDFDEQETTANDSFIFNSGSQRRGALCVRAKAAAVIGPVPIRAVGPSVFSMLRPLLAVFFASEARNLSQSFLNAPFPNLLQTVSCDLQVAKKTVSVQKTRFAIAFFGGK